MLVFAKERLVLLSVPKTGTTALEAALGPRAAMWVQAPPELKHAPLYRYNRFYRPALDKFIGPELEIVAVMRHPVDWLGSWWRYRRRPALDGTPQSTGGIGFDEFVAAYCRGKRPPFADVGSQAKFLAPQPNGTRVHRLFRYEDQTTFLRFLEDRLQRPVAVERRNVSPRGEADGDLSPETAEILYRKHAEDFSLWEAIEVGNPAVT